MRKSWIILSIVLAVVLGCVMVGQAAAGGGIEQTQLREQNLKVFKNADGTTTYSSYINPIHYLSDEYKWEEIDRSIKDIDKDSKVKGNFKKDFENSLKDITTEENTTPESYNKGLTDHMFKMYFPKKLNHSILFKYNDFVLSLKPLNVLNYNTQQESNSSAKKNEITYKDVWYKTDVKYEITYTGFKEYITLNSIDSERNISFFIKAIHFDLKPMPDGQIGAYDKKDSTLIFVIPRPTMWDAANVYCDDISYKLERAKNGYILTVLPNENYLNAPERVFPLTIDPDIEITTTTGVYEKTYLDSTWPTTVHPLGTQMNVGHFPIYNPDAIRPEYGVRTSLLRFWNFTGSTVPSSTTNVTHATLTLDNSVDSAGESTYIYIYANKYDGSNWYVDTATWNSWQPHLEDLSIKYTGTPGRFYMDKNEEMAKYTAEIDPAIVKAWFLPQNNKGFSLIPEASTYKYDLKKFTNASLNVTISEPFAVTASAALYPNTPQTAQFTSTVTPAGGQYTYSWDFDYNDPNNDNDTRPNPTHTYSKSGTYIYTLTAKCSTGEVITKTGTIYIPPTNISVSYGETSDPQNLMFKLDTHNYDNQTFTWNFGDGSPNTTGTIGRHRYTYETTYNVTLTVKDAQGVSAQLTKEVRFYKPLILVHGYGDDFTCWTEQVEHLKNIVYNGDLLVKNVGGMEDISTFANMPLNTAFNLDFYRATSTSLRFQQHGKIGPDTTIQSTTASEYNTLTYTYSDQLRRLVDKICTATGFAKVDIVAHSMGGLVSRSYIKYYGGNNKVEHLLTVGTPNHGIRSVDSFVASYLTSPQAWQRDLEIREMTSSSQTFSNVTSGITNKSYVALLNGEDSIGLFGGLSGCNGQDTIGPTKYATIAGRDDGGIDLSGVLEPFEFLYELLSPSDGVIEHYSVKLTGQNVDANVTYPGIHSSGSVGADRKAPIQILPQTPYIASYVNAWMHHARIASTLPKKPAATITVELQPGQTYSTIKVHTNATRENAIWVWVMLQREEDIANTAYPNGYTYSFKNYNSYWKDLSNQTVWQEAVFDLSTAHYNTEDKLRVIVLTYDTRGYTEEIFNITGSGADTQPYDPGNQ